MKILQVSLIILLAIMILSCGNSGISIDDSSPSVVDSNSHNPFGAKLNYDSLNFKCSDVLSETELSELMGVDYKLQLDMAGGDTCSYEYNLIEDQSSWNSGCKRKIQIKFYINDGFGDRNIDSLLGCQKSDGKLISNKFSSYGTSRSCLLKAFNPLNKNSKDMELKTGTISGDNYVRLEVQYKFIDKEFYDYATSNDPAGQKEYQDKCIVDSIKDDKEQITEDLMKVTTKLMAELYK